MKAENESIVSLFNDGYEIQFSDLANENQFIRINKTLVFHPVHRYAVCFLCGINDETIDNASKTATIEIDSYLKTMFKNYDEVLNKKYTYESPLVWKQFDNSFSYYNYKYPKDTLKRKLSCVMQEMINEKEDNEGCNPLYDETINFVINKLELIVK